MKEAFRDSLGLSKANIEKLKIVNQIIADYERQGYRLTLRQLYYQLVSKDIIPNKLTEYQKLSTLLVKARMGGAVDWNACGYYIRRTKRCSYGYRLSHRHKGLNDWVKVE
jgi:hypothetical protein